jgi:hypothetical protein
MVEVRMSPAAQAVQAALLLLGYRLTDEQAEAIANAALQAAQGNENDADR